MKLKSPYNYEGSMEVPWDSSQKARASPEMWLVIRAEATALCNGNSDWAQANCPTFAGREKRVRREVEARLRRSGGERGREEIDGDDRTVAVLAVEIRDLDSDDPQRQAIFGVWEMGKWSRVLIRVLGIESYRNSCNCRIIGPVLDPAMLVQGPEWPIRSGFEYEL